MTTTDPKTELTRPPGAVLDTSTLGTQLSSLSITKENVDPSSPSAYQVFILAGFGHGYTLKP
jgi:hypothetical protein